ncbi:hypothetical protein K491DRAFT_714274 [Lophiostoma macrostomum CBS 122681]|uniref:Uncharacterized protein n=1 Tax=Lophiostoma macrostomum CBS 122681 TaxID=1314788 RepID=A0A6A6TDU8_9PLEO|nr:hypothetical protein K491DRAFT_714274 [Lophiostoma macrostomum CBS 122681]
MDTNVGSRPSRARGARPQPITIDPFVDMSSLANALTNDTESQLSPETPIFTTFGEILTLHQKVESLGIENSDLRGIIKEMNIKLEDLKLNARIEQSRPSAPQTPGSVGSMGSFAGMFMTPPSGLYRTPTSVVQSGGPMTPTSNGFSAKTSGRHQSARGSTGPHRSRPLRRASTPPQMSTRRMTQGVPLYTIGMEPQDDQGLLADFFDAITIWAQRWTTLNRMLAPSELDALAESDSPVKNLGENVDVRLLLRDDDRIRIFLVAALVSHDIVYNTFCDTFLFTADFPEVNEIREIFNQFKELGEGHETEKHQLNLKQRALYTRVKNMPNHDIWRLNTAKHVADKLINGLGPLIGVEDPTIGTSRDRHHELLELCVKGFRIGFRMRMEAVKWRMVWPEAGQDFDIEWMVNQSRYLHGSISNTLAKVAQSPSSYTTRFAMSPLIVKADYSKGIEQLKVSHKAMVHVVKKSNTIGAERAHLMHG